MPQILRFADRETTVAVPQGATLADDRLYSQRLFSIHVIGFFYDKGRAAADNLRARLAGQVGLTFGGHSEEFPHRPEISSVLEARYILGNPQGGLFDRQRDATMIGAGKLGRAHDTHAHSRRHRLSTGFAATGWLLTWVVSGLYLGLLVAGSAAPLVDRLIHRRGGRPVLAVTRAARTVRSSCTVSSAQDVCAKVLLAPACEITGIPAFADEISRTQTVVHPQNPKLQKAWISASGRLPVNFCGNILAPIGQKLPESR